WEKPMKSVDAYLDTHHDQFQADLCELLRIPSVSADSRHQGYMHTAAEWVANQFRSLNLTTEIVRTPGHPMVYAETPRIPGQPTVLVYGHYDVQPPDPLHEWITPPFEPTIRDGNVYVRGAT